LWVKCRTGCPQNDSRHRPDGLAEADEGDIKEDGAELGPSLEIGPGLFDAFGLGLLLGSGLIELAPQSFLGLLGKALNVRLDRMGFSPPQAAPFRTAAVRRFWLEPLIWKVSFASILWSWFAFHHRQGSGSLKTSSCRFEQEDCSVKLASQPRNQPLGSDGAFGR
jgi:hypothetical protein